MLHFVLKISLVILFYKNVSASTFSEPPRGADIGALAGNCSVGPFGQTGDTGEYADICNSLTLDERCFAYLKQHLKEDGKIYPASDKAKATFCSNSIYKKFAD